MDMMKNKMMEMYKMERENKIMMENKMDKNYVSTTLGTVSSRNILIFPSIFCS